MKGRRCDLANALAANWGAKVDPMPEIGAAVDLPNLLLRGLATSPQTSRSVVGTTTAAPCAPTPSVSLLLVGVRSRCHQSAARSMACSEECVSSGVRADRRPQARRPCRWRVSIPGPGAPDRSSWDQGFASRRRKSWFRAWGAACGGAEGDAGSSNGWGSRLYSVQQGSSSPLTGSVSAIFPAPRFRPQA